MGSLFVNMDRVVAVQGNGGDCPGTSLAPGISSVPSDGMCTTTDEGDDTTSITCGPFTLTSEDSYTVCLCDSSGNDDNNCDGEIDKYSVKATGAAQVSWKPVAQFTSNTLSPVEVNLGSEATLVITGQHFADADRAIIVSGEACDGAAGTERSTIGASCNVTPTEISCAITPTTPPTDSTTTYKVCVCDASAQADNTCNAIEDYVLEGGTAQWLARATFTSGTLAPDPVTEGHASTVHIVGTNFDAENDGLILIENGGSCGSDDAASSINAGGCTGTSVALACAVTMESANTYEVCLCDYSGQNPNSCAAASNYDLSNDVTVVWDHALTTSGMSMSPEVVNLGTAANITVTGSYFTEDDKLILISNEDTCPPASAALSASNPTCSKTSSALTCTVTPTTDANAEATTYKACVCDYSASPELTCATLDKYEIAVAGTVTWDANVITQTTFTTPSPVHPLVAAEVHLTGQYFNPEKDRIILTTGTEGYVVHQLML